MLVASLLHGASERTEEIAWPPDPDGTLLRQLLATFEPSPVSEPALSDFVNEHFSQAWLKESSPEAQVEFLRTVATLSHGFQVWAIDASRPRENEDRAWSLLSRSRGDRRWKRVRVGFATEEPTRFRSLTIVPAAPPADSTSIEDGLQTLDSYLREMEDEDKFSGVVLIGRGNQILYEKACGPADRRWSVPNVTRTRFDSGSLGMMFTAVAVMRLAERGRIDLDEPIDRLRWGSITPRHLLAQESGLGNFFEGPYWNRSRSRYRRLSDYQGLIEPSQQRFPPGSDWSLSRDGYLLLGDLLERATQLSWEEVIRREVFQPARMDSTEALDADQLPGDVALGYTSRGTPRQKHWRETRFLRPWRATPAGGQFTSAHDLFRFLRSLAGGRLLTEESLRQIWTVTVASQHRTPYGLGFTIFEMNEEGQADTIGHEADFPGSSGHVELRLKDDWTLIVLSNIDGGASAVTPQIDRWLSLWSYP